MNNPSPRSDSPAPLEIESLLSDDERRIKTITVQAHADFREHCRDTLAEIARLEREADLLTQLNTSKS